MGFTNIEKARWRAIRPARAIKEAVECLYHFEDIPEIADLIPLLEDRAKMLEARLLAEFDSENRTEG